MGACRLLLLFSPYLIAKMQSVVTGQAPETLEWKINSGGKNNEVKLKIVHTITNTNRIPQAKNKK